MSVGLPCTAAGLDCGPDETHSSPARGPIALMVQSGRPGPPQAAAAHPPKAAISWPAADFPRLPGLAHPLALVRGLGPSDAAVAWPDANGSWCPPKHGRNSLDIAVPWVCRKGSQDGYDASNGATLAAEFNSILVTTGFVR